MLAAAVALAVLAVALLTRSALAQDIQEFDLTGSVVGEQGRPLVGAEVSLADADWGVLTDRDGRFVLPDLIPGRVELHVRQLGYADARWTGVVGPGSDAPLVRLEPKAVMLEGLKVVADRFESRRRGYPHASRSFEREDVILSGYSSMADWLHGRGGLFLTDCRTGFASTCVWSRGSAVAPQVYIDEAPVFAGIQYLSMIQPHEVYRVEIFRRGRQIRVYTQNFMARAARTRLQPIALW